MKLLQMKTFEQLSQDNRSMGRRKVQLIIDLLRGKQLKADNGGWVLRKAAIRSSRWTSEHRK